MHVHAIIDTLQVGGAENLLLDFAAGGAKVGIRTTVSYLNGLDPLALPRLDALGIETRLTPVSSLFSVAQARGVREELAAQKPDVVHTHLSSSDYVGSRAARALGIPSVSTLHSAGPPDSWRSQLREPLVARTRRRCSARVIAVSEAARLHYLAHGWDSPERVVTVRNGIIPRDARGEGPRIRRELGLDPEDLVFATVSVLKPGKGHRVAIDLVAELRRQGLPARLLVLGEGPLLSELHEYMSRSDGVGMTLGHRDDVAAVLDAVDILLHPSEQDAFPGALLEAMGARVPALATRVGGIPEIVIEDETGLLVTPPPAVEQFLEPAMRLARDPALRRRLGEAGRRRLDEHFTVEAWMRRLLPLYEDVVAGRQSAAVSSSASSTGT